VTQLTNDALYEQLGSDGYAVGDDIFIFAGAPIVQAGAVAVKAQVHRVVKNLTVNAALIMRSKLTNDAPPFAWLLNDGANDIRVYAFVGELMNGTLNNFFTVTAGNAALFVGIPTQLKRKGGFVVAGTLDWRPALIT